MESTPFRQAPFGPNKLDFDPAQYGVNSGNPGWDEVIRQSHGDLMLFATEAHMFTAQGDRRAGRISPEEYDQIIADGYISVGQRRHELGLPPRT